MPEQFVIEGGKALKGEVEVRGSKNAAGALLAACLLTGEECFIDNLPLVRDIFNLLDILKEMGCEVEFLSERKVRLKAGDNVNPEKINFEKFSRARTSVLLIGPLVARFKEFKISRPGGDRIGLRPITTHLDVLAKLGVVSREEGDFYHFKSDDLRGREIILPEFSVTATENLLMAACLAKGQTVIKLAAQEPHIQCLVEQLRKMGGSIEKVCENCFSVNGTGGKLLAGVEQAVVSDYIESGTFVIAAVLAGDDVLVKNAVPEYLDAFWERLSEMGARFRIEGGDVMVSPGASLNAIRLQALPYPGFPTDLLPLMVPLLTQAKGKSLIHDPLYENRLNYIHQLRKMGADIEIVDPHRAFVFGPTPLAGVAIESWDIRAGASLVVAGLTAKGQTVINNIEQIDRGYETIEKRLQALGAEIKRVTF
ncbi:MAG: UDP-N-acetylglucosamine 1-carboxyvinyltransferase [Candidatus Pacebacteria bacterium]|nr:UDP-N-acetylglucosamine 1-carboxyvinyltransferase [Candidatus Paceibacterota bacterium]